MQLDNLGSLMSPRYYGPSDAPRGGADPAASAIFAPRIYLADPDPLTRTQLAEYLRDKGFDIIAATDMDTAPPPVDVVIVALDSMIQRANKPNWLVAKPEVPTIVLDRPSVFPGRAAPLGFTPDARLSLPVHPRKLMATIRRILSLARVDSVDLREATAFVYSFSGWKLYPDRRLESSDGKTVLVEKRDFELLKALLTFPRHLLTRQQLIAIVWGSDSAIKNRTLDRSITHLRRHLGDDVRFPALIKTVVGVGYRLDVDVDVDVEKS